MAPRKKAPHELAIKPKVPCKRCGKPRTVTSSRASSEHCASCVSVIAYETRTTKLHAPCLVTFHKIERWHQYDRATMLSSNR
ncbi:hypothetical protein SEA_EASTWEST_63 [Arthrobacter phage EastWest]|uniref:Uncharacterized protein n=1 Tax=Arthrobacter phage EastWest TaxID=2894292 RepID=A0AAE8YLU9_9CAUD|nr:hypothetical protein SEA_EASTWEST_63 [Arthrobacter phage EastWest]